MAGIGCLSGIKAGDNHDTGPSLFVVPVSLVVFLLQKGVAFYSLCYVPLGRGKGAGRTGSHVNLSIKVWRRRYAWVYAGRCPV